MSADWLDLTEIIPTLLTAEAKDGQDMSDKRIQATARVQVVIEVTASLWGEDCSIGQLYKQAAEDGINQVRKLIVESGCKARVFGEPKIIGVITEQT